MSDKFDIGAYKFRAIIFDCDGTLANTGPVHYLAFSHAFNDIGLDMPEDWYRQRAGLSRGKLFDAFRQEKDTEFDSDEMASKSEKIYRDHIDRVTENRFVADIARHENGRVPMAVASAGQRAIVEATLKTIGLRDLFDQVVTVEEVQHPKPAPDLFLLAAKRLNTSPEDCLVFEDSDEGLEAARNAGMQVVDVRPFTTDGK
ncbi:HAD family hydrolase [Kozakia baliensis]|uniref:HAD family hydrolase n=1 Tax=Kozakia baliensis TaxID=153496 RepID=UPI0004955031|nr:HAD family phosphatase [Kozakia baliensis]